MWNGGVQRAADAAVVTPVCTSPTSSRFLPRRNLFMFARVLRYQGRIVATCRFCSASSYGLLELAQGLPLTSSIASPGACKTVATRARWKESARIRSKWKRNGKDERSSRINKKRKPNIRAAQRRKPLLRSVLLKEGSLETWSDVCYGIRFQQPNSSAFGSRGYESLGTRSLDIVAKSRSRGRQSHWNTF